MRLFFPLPLRTRPFAENKHFVAHWVASFSDSFCVRVPPLKSSSNKKVSFFAHGNWASEYGVIFPCWFSKDIITTGHIVMFSMGEKANGLLSRALVLSREGPTGCWE